MKRHCHQHLPNYLKPESLLIRRTAFIRFLTTKTIIVTHTSEINDCDDSVSTATDDACPQHVASPQESFTRPVNSPTGDAINVFRGFCMGAADTVPGVSGGTVALILGHYDRLIAVISNVDSESVSMLAKRRWRALAEKLDLRFAIALGVGIVLAFGILARLMHWLLLHRMNEINAVFFGLVLASVWVVRRNVIRWSVGRYVGAAIGIAIALGVSQIPAASGEVSLVYLFVSAAIAICAMILPGISGAFVLLLLGVYEPVIGMVKQFFKFEFDLQIITRLTVFAAGCGFGLLAFSRVLNYLLAHHRDVTMATLIGLMIGSVGRIWPLQVVTPETAAMELKFQKLVYVSPAQYEGSVVFLAVLAIVASGIVLLADRVTRQMTSNAI
jgi:putative membrane protein